MYSWRKCVEKNIDLAIIKIYLSSYLINPVVDLTNFKIFFMIIIFKLSKILFCHINFLWQRV